MHCDAVKKLVSRESGGCSLTASAADPVVVPVIIVYIILQKHIIKDMTSGAVKDRAVIRMKVRVQYVQGSDH